MNKQQELTARGIEIAKAALRGMDEMREVAQTLFDENERLRKQVRELRRE